MVRTMIDKPMVSFCVKSYNQREYIGAALDGAFAQTYRPLEIVVSDDCSTDGTAELIQQIINEYKAAGGDIPVVFNRNKENLGNLGNWIVFGKLTHGELLVKADGDDISLAERTEKVVSAWLADRRRAKIIQHRAIVIDKYGRVLRGTVGDNGSCQAYSRDLWDCFPVTHEIDRRLKIYDDAEFSVRACAIGGEVAILAIDDILVKYRFGSGDTTIKMSYRETMFMDWTVLHDSLTHGLKEVALNRSTLVPGLFDGACTSLEWLARESALNARLVDARSDWCSRLASVRELENDFGRISLRDRLFHLVFLLPRMLADALLAPYFRFFYFRRKYSQ